MIACDRNGVSVEVYDAQSGLIKFLYTNRFGQVLLSLLVKSSVSRFVGHFMDSALSKFMIKSFIRNNNIDLTQYQKQEFSSYNDCFCRKIKSQFRPFDSELNHLVSPCDAKLTICDISADSKFEIKGHKYTLAELLKDEKLAKHYDGGKLAIFRLSVDDYHRYSFFDSGKLVSQKKISGVFHTVNPLAASLRPIYKENTRTYSILETKNFGKAIQMEVGALLVGRIVNESLNAGAHFSRGEEKGHFEFGGSTVILIFEKGAAIFDEDIEKNSSEDIETIVKMGERIGHSK